MNPWITSNGQLLVYCVEAVSGIVVGKEAAAIQLVAVDCLPHARFSARLGVGSLVESLPVFEELVWQAPKHSYSYSFALLNRIEVQ
jgi:hypothetical protein